MSGLEILGAVAGAVQLADVCAQVITFISDLYSKVRGAPETIRARIAQIEQLIKIAKLIENNAALQTPLVHSIIAKCLEDTGSLLKILKKLDTDGSATRAVRYWKALGGVTKEKQILAICERLEERKSSLALCVASINS